MGQLNCKDCFEPGPVAADGGRHAWDKDGDGEVSFLERMEGMSGSVVDAAGDVVEYIDDRIDMPVIIGECFVAAQSDVRCAFATAAAKDADSILVTRGKCR